MVVLAYNHLADTLECLASLSHLTYPNYRVLVVDNGSSDGTAETIRAQYPHVQVLRLNRNIGFQGGANFGVQSSLDAGTDYVFLLSNDTTVQPDILHELMKCAEPVDVGLLAPKIYYFSDPHRIWSVGGDRHPLTLEMTRKGDNQLDRGQWDQVQARDFLVGCALLIKRSLVETIGPFDTGFHPAYYEDVDLCMRARQAGFRLLLVPGAQMWHKVARSHGGQGSPQERYLMARNSVRYFRKYVRSVRWFIVAPYRLGSALKTTLRLMRARRFDSIRAYWRGLRDGFRLPTTTVHTLP
ncbi:MAG: glycosyltransferase family 2 protein [Chloroflexi bacterium]|nr:glycosyltransferase family 2 protein [Chloroflexota bacterium]